MGTTSNMNTFFSLLYDKKAFLSESFGFSSEGCQSPNRGHFTPLSWVVASSSALKSKYFSQDSPKKHLYLLPCSIHCVGLPGRVSLCHA